MREVTDGVEHLSSRNYEPQLQFSAEPDDMVLSLPSQMLMPCPSSWHTLSDRHSPILPSSHVAHKISQREKQIQFQEFKRRQQLEQHFPHPGMALWDVSLGRNTPQAYDLQAKRSTSTGSSTSQTIGSWPHYSSLWHTMSNGRPYDSQTFSSGYYEGFPIQQHPQYGAHNQQLLTPNHCDQPFRCVQSNISFLPSAQVYMYSNINVQTMPPSPPPSPLGGPHHIYNTPQLISNYPSQCYQMIPNHCENEAEMAYPLIYNGTLNALPKHCQKPKCGAPKYITKNQQASIKRCDVIPQPSNELKSHVTPVPSCALASTSCTKPTEIPTTEAEVDQHMSIVEPSRSPENREYVDLPSIGSFLEYLNEV